jgi:DNA-damage-inducible protein D
MAKTLSQFESIKHTENNFEFWYARELSELLGYPRFDSFKRLVQKTILDFESNIEPIHNHVELLEIEENDNPKPKQDYKLSRKFCYQLAMLGSTPECVGARSYFAIQTIKQENQEEQISLEERKKIRKQSKESYKSYNSALIESGINSGQVGLVTSMGDKALFGNKTAKIKLDNNIDNDRPLEDFLHPASMVARMLGREMTKIKVESEQVDSLKKAISTHYKHNKEIRQVLQNNEITPENLPMQEDIKGQLLPTQTLPTPKLK